LHDPLNKILNEGGYYILGVLFFVAMAIILYRVAMQKESFVEKEIEAEEINIK
jgi:hypothetical protein